MEMESGLEVALPVPGNSRLDGKPPEGGRMRLEVALTSS